MHYIVTAEFSDGRHENRTFESRAQAETSFQEFSYMSKCNNAKWSRSDTGEVLGAYIAPLPTPAKPPSDGNALQNAEFDAFVELAKQFRRHHMTLVVDDDYPEIKHDYERALRALLAASKANGRLQSQWPHAVKWFIGIAAFLFLCLLVLAANQDAKEADACHAAGGIRVRADAYQGSGLICVQVQRIPIPQ